LRKIDFFAPEIIKNKLLGWRHKLLPYVVNYALEYGFLPGRKDYTRFIILGRSRTGSNFLRGLLNSHDQVVVYGEIFQNKNSIGWALPGFSNNGQLMQEFYKQPTRFVEQRVYKKFPVHTCAVGFKIFYYHAQDEAWIPVWDYLRQHREIKVLHIIRRNILRTHLSRKLAMLNDLWVNTNGNTSKKKSVRLDYSECLNDFQQTWNWQQEYARLFLDHDLMEVVYEDLAADYRPVMQDVLGFLEVESNIDLIKPETHKQAQTPLPIAIENYYELKEMFKDTSWASFFDE
jgi:LPS sulfotransferase NodH